MLLFFIFVENMNIKIDHSQLMKLTDLVFKDRKISVDALIVHGWGDLAEEMIEYTAKTFKETKARYIALNGADEYERGAPGYLYWKNSLTKKYFINQKAIIKAKASMHTGKEAKSFAECMHTHHITKACILSVPQHIVRAFLTNLHAVQNIGLKVRLYPKTIKTADWHEKIIIRHPLGYTDITTRIGRFASDFGRIIEYRSRVEQGDKNYLMASLQEGIKHLSSVSSRK